MYDPVTENLSEYLERVTRLVLALKTLGHNVSAVDLERITMKAEMLKEAFDLVGPEPKSLVRALRERFTRLALDEVLSEQEKSVQVGCIGELILGLGGKESAASDKLFSTPSIEDGAVGLPTRSATKPGGLGEPRVGLAADRDGGGESPLRAKVAALEMELEALKRGSEVSVRKGTWFLLWRLRPRCFKKHCRLVVLGEVAVVLLLSRLTCSGQPSLMRDRRPETLHFSMKSLKMFVLWPTSAKA